MKTAMEIKLVPLCICHTWNGICHTWNGICHTWNCICHIYPSHNRTPPNLGRGASKIGRNRSLSQDKLGQKAHVNFAFNVKGTLEAANAMGRTT